MSETEACRGCNGTGRVAKRVFHEGFKSAAKEIREAAKGVRENKSHWPGEPDMQRMCIQDAKDMREVAKLLGAGDARGASNKAGGMDTAARDHIPQAAWEFMQERAEEAYKAAQSTGS